MDSKQSNQWTQAMQEEMESHKQNGTWELVERPQDTKLLDSRWVYKVMTNQDGSIERYKARLVVRGYRQQFGIDYNETFASVSRAESLRLLMAIAAANQLVIKQFDVKTAFLHGNLDEVIYMSQPEGFESVTDKVCLLKKSLYGLKQSPRQWRERITTFLATLKLFPSSADPSVFTGFIDG